MSEQARQHSQIPIPPNLRPEMKEVYIDHCITHLIQKLFAQNKVSQRRASAIMAGVAAANSCQMADPFAVIELGQGFVDMYCAITQNHANSLQNDPVWKLRASVQDNMAVKMATAKSMNQTVLLNIAPPTLVLAGEDKQEAQDGNPQA